MLLTQNKKVAPCGKSPDSPRISNFIYSHTTLLSKEGELDFSSQCCLHYSPNCPINYFLKYSKCVLCSWHLSLIFSSEAAFQIGYNIRKKELDPCVRLSSYSEIWFLLRKEMIVFTEIHLARNPIWRWGSTYHSLKKICSNNLVTTLSLPCKYDFASQVNLSKENCFLS